MSKRDEIQTAINQASLMMNVDADVSRALKKAEIHPDLAKIIMRMHHTQVELDRRVKEVAAGQLEMARVISKLVDNSAINSMAIERIGQATGKTPEQLFGPEEEEANE